MIKASYFWAIIDLQIEQKSIQNSISLHFSGRAVIAFFELIMFALLNFYMLLLVQTDPNNLTGRQLQSDFHFVLTISRSVSYAQHLKLI